LTHYPYLNSADDVRVSLTVADERLVIRIVEKATPALLPPGPPQLTLTRPPQPARHCAFQSEGYNMNGRFQMQGPYTETVDLCFEPFFVKEIMRVIE
jgi:hypothetical protein